MKKHQIIVIHGGNTFRTRKEAFVFLKNIKLDMGRYKKAANSWKRRLDVDLGKGFEVMWPEMPNSWDAKYREWKVWFEKFIPYFEKEVVLIGHSLGGIFLAKFLAEEKFPKKVRATFLVAPPFRNRGGNFALPKSLKRLEKQAGKIFLYASKDDDQVEFSHFEQYRKRLKNATARTFDDKKHFNVPRLPELVDDVKNLYR